MGHPTGLGHSQDSQIREDLYWDGAYAIARQLQAAQPQIDLSQVTLNMIYNWVIALPDFKDEPDLANDDLLAAIYQEWYEETHPL
jgi:FeS assembly protein IscX